VEIGVDAILFQQEIGKDGTRSFYRQGFAKAALAFDQKIHLGAEGGARFFLVELGEKRIVFAVIGAARVEALGKNLRQSRLADAKRTFDDDKSRGLGAALRGRRAPGGGFTRHAKGSAGRRVKG